MTDRDLLGPVDPAGPRKRRPSARALGSVSGALSRLVPRPRGVDRSGDAGTGIRMSDEELREAFRLASLTVTPAPLGRPSRRADPPPHGGETGDSKPGGSPPLRTPTVAPPPAEAAAAPTSGSTSVPEALPISAWASVPEPVPASLAAAIRPPPPPAASSGTGSGLDPAPDAGRPLGDLPDPAPDDQMQLPGNLGFSVDDFFGGLVRRIERRP